MLRTLCGLADSGRAVTCQDSPDRQLMSNPPPVVPGSEPFGRRFKHVSQGRRPKAGKQLGVRAVDDELESSRHRAPIGSAAARVPASMTPTADTVTPSLVMPVSLAQPAPLLLHSVARSRTNRWEDRQPWCFTRSR